MLSGGVGGGVLNALLSYAFTIQASFLLASLCLFNWYRVT